MSGRTGVWLSAIALGLAGGCTDPIFQPPADASVGSDAVFPGEIQRNELLDTGVESAETGVDPAVTAECDGGTCRSLDGGTLLAPQDSGMGDTGPDAEVDAALDETRAKWAGRYAARSAMFTFDDPFKGSAKLLSVIEIVPTPEGGLRLDEELCYFEGGWSFFFTGVLKYKFVDARGSVPLQYGKDRFEAPQMTLQIGYGPAPAGCTPGATMTKSEAQTWLTSTCDCPRNSDLPTSPRDCRVTDPEKDNEPGATFSAALDASPIVFRATQEERVRILEGYRLGDRLYADRWFEDTTRILSCTLDGTLTPAASCPLGKAKTCPSRHNRVELVPIKEPIKCEQVIAMEQGLFLSPLGNYPETCPSEIAAQSRP